MRADPTELLDRLAAIRERIAVAAAASGREPEAVTLVAAAKTRTPEEVDALLAAGLREVGHNYVQEAAAMRPALARPAVWRLIGHLQRNKVGHALRWCDTVDTVDTAALAEALQQRCEREGREVSILLQVRLGDEATKSGADPSEVDALLTAVQQMPRLHCHGLMTMPPPAEPAVTRPYFAQLRELAERLRARSGLPLTVLSMGMSGDYEVAIAEGATHVRLGTALFGPRPARPGEE